MLKGYYHLFQSLNNSLTLKLVPPLRLVPAFKVIGDIFMAEIGDHINCLIILYLL